MSAAVSHHFFNSIPPAVTRLDRHGHARRATWLSAVLLLAAAFFAGPASAAIDLRVESRPISNPIEAYVTVTDSSGNPVGGLAAGNFTLALTTDAGTPLPSPVFEFSQPPAENPDKNVSVVFALDYSPSTEGAPRTNMQNAVIAFINSMAPGDYAAIVKFNGTNANEASVVQPFVQVGGGTDELVTAVMAEYPGIGSNIFDGINVALDHIASPPAGVTLPSGPRAVVLISDGDDNASANTQNFVIDKASSLGIPCSRSPWEARARTVVG